MRCVFAAAAGAWMVPVLVASYFTLVAKEKFLFGIYGYHVLTGRDQDALWWLISFLLSSWSNTGFWSILVLAAGIVLLYVQRCRARPQYSFEWFVFGIWVAITLIHLSRHPTHAIYQTPLAWTPMILAAWMLRRLIIWQRLQTHKQSGAVLSPARASALATAILLLFSMTWLNFQNGSLESNAARRPEFLATFLKAAEPQEGEKLISFEAGV